MVPSAARRQVQWCIERFLDFGIGLDEMVPLSAWLRSARLRVLLHLRANSRGAWTKTPQATCRDVNGATPLHSAAASQMSAICMTFIPHSPLLAKTVNEMTALDLAHILHLAAESPLAAAPEPARAACRAPPHPQISTSGRTSRRASAPCRRRRWCAAQGGRQSELRFTQ